MKLERLLSIIIILLNRRMIQAKELAERFEVSVRTIYRDIDAINRAGIPIVTYQGAGGGIGLTDGYMLDRNLLTDHELASIFTALRSLSTTEANRNDSSILMEKIQQVVSPARAEQFKMDTEQFMVDLSYWGVRSGMEEKLVCLKQAIRELKVVSCTYRSADGHLTSRTLEPHTLVLKQRQWYVYGYCQLRSQFRMFKLLRMTNVTIQPESFIRRSISLEQLPWQQEWTAPENTIRLVLRVTQEALHKVEEYIGEDALEVEEEDFRIYVVHFPENDWLYGFILSLGSGVEVLEPAHVRTQISSMIDRMMRNYAAYTE